MANTNSLTLGTLREAVQIQEQIEKLQSRLSAVLGGSSSPAAAAPVKRGPKPGSKRPVRRSMSKAARAKIAAAARLRWAKVKGTASHKAAAKSKPKAPTRKAKRGGLTPEGRARLAAAMKARWAARKSAGAPAS